MLCLSRKKWQKFVERYNTGVYKYPTHVYILYLSIRSLAPFRSLFHLFLSPLGNLLLLLIHLSFPALPSSSFLPSFLPAYLPTCLAACLLAYPFPLIWLYRKNGRSLQASRRCNKWISPFSLSPVFLIHANALVTGNNDLLSDLLCKQQINNPNYRRIYRHQYRFGYHLILKTHTARKNKRIKFILLSFTF